jgi:lambda repressor-like predicted transcriptional regulator
MKLTKTQIIGAVLFVTGKSVETVATENCYSKAAFYNVFSGGSKSPKLRALICEIVAPVVDEIVWPEPAEEEKE